MLPDFRHLGPEEWRLLQDVRLTALKDSPRAFLASHDKENGYGREQWEAEFKRGDWIIGELDGKPICLTGVTHETDASTERYLEYVWVAPDHRRSGIACHMLESVLRELGESGTRTVFLWVLDDNDAALLLYKRLDFVSTNDLQPLEVDPSRSELRFRRDLT